jgi:hypothetical protein
MAASNQTKTGRDVAFWLYGAASYSAAVTSTKVLRVDHLIFGDVSHNFGAIQEQIITRIRGSWKGTRNGDDPVFQISFSMPFREYGNTSVTTAMSILTGTGYAWATDSWVKQTAQIERNNFGIHIITEGSDHGDDSDYFVDFTACTASIEQSENRNGETIANVTITSPDFVGMTYGTV